MDLLQHLFGPVAPRCHFLKFNNSLIIKDIIIKQKLIKIEDENPIKLIYFKNNFAFASSFDRSKFTNFT